MIITLQYSTNQELIPSRNKIVYPEVYKSYSKVDLNNSRSNASMLFEDNKSIKNISKRYETETADTDTSFGYKFIVKPTSRNSYNEDLTVVGHNGKL